MTATVTPETTSERPSDDARGASGSVPPEARIAIVGAGFGGLATAIRLKQAGIHDFVVLERGDDVGGTWRDNSYPGCTCDVPSHLYSFSFAMNPNWSRAFSPQPEIQAYLQRCADQFNLRPHIYLGADMHQAQWDNAAQRWRVRTARGELTCQVIIAAQGPLSSPSLPAVPGLSTFAGETFHSATWRHDYDLTGKRVAVVGTGASAIQFVPYVQQHAAHMTLFQRHQRLGEAAFPKLASCPTGRAGRYLLGTRGHGAAPSRQRADAFARREDSPPTSGAPGARPAAASETHAPFPAGLQAGPAQQRLLPRP
jgi:cation diffusion facilitator CzcD-associated flavoprotein CzcO